MGIVLRNSSAGEVYVPPKTVIGNVQMAEIVLNMKALNRMCDVLPSEKQKELSQVG